MDDRLRVFLNNLSADSGEILRLGYGNAAAQIKQGLCKRLYDDFISSLYKSDPVAFCKV